MLPWAVSVAIWAMRSSSNKTSLHSSLRLNLRMISLAVVFFWCRAVWRTAVRTWSLEWMKLSLMLRVVRLLMARNL